MRELRSKEIAGGLRHVGGFPGTTLVERAAFGSSGKSPEDIYAWLRSICVESHS